MAEIMGLVYKLLFVFLQDARGLYSRSSLMKKILGFQPFRDFYFFRNHLRFCFCRKIDCKMINVIILVWRSELFNCAAVFRRMISKWDMSFVVLICYFCDSCESCMRAVWRCRQNHPRVFCDFSLAANAASSGHKLAFH